jgi:hypothetical protein
MSDQSSIPENLKEYKGGLSFVSSRGETHDHVR